MKLINRETAAYSVKSAYFMGYVEETKTYIIQQT